MILGIENSSFVLPVGLRRSSILGIEEGLNSLSLLERRANSSSLILAAVQDLCSIHRQTQALRRQLTDVALPPPHQADGLPESNQQAIHSARPTHKLHGNHASSIHLVSGGLGAEERRRWEEQSSGDGRSSGSSGDGSSAGDGRSGDDGRSSGDDGRSGGDGWGGGATTGGAAAATGGAAATGREERRRREEQRR
jgi:hypothetical protein